MWAASLGKYFAAIGPKDFDTEESEMSRRNKMIFAVGAVATLSTAIILITWQRPWFTTLNFHDVVPIPEFSPNLHLSYPYACWIDIERNSIIVVNAASNSAATTGPFTLDRTATENFYRTFRGKALVETRKGLALPAEFGFIGEIPKRKNAMFLIENGRISEAVALAPGSAALFYRLNLKPGDRLNRLPSLIRANNGVFDGQKIRDDLDKAK